MKANKLTKETVLLLGVKERPTFAPFNIGDSVRVSQRIIEAAGKERLQAFDGDVIRIRHHGIATTFTVRKIGANSVAIERIFPYHSPMVASVAVLRRGEVRKAKLYYMRDRIGKAAQTDKIRVSTREENKASASSSDNSNPASAS